MQNPLKEFLKGIAILRGAEIDMVQGIILDALKAQRNIYAEGWQDGFQAGQNWIGQGTHKIEPRNGTVEQHLLAKDFRRVTFPTDPQR